MYHSIHKPGNDRIRSEKYIDRESCKQWQKNIYDPQDPSITHTFLDVIRNPIPESNAANAPTKQAIPMSPNIIVPITIPITPKIISKIPITFIFVSSIIYLQARRHAVIIPASRLFSAVRVYFSSDTRSHPEQIPVFR